MNPPPCQCLINRARRGFTPRLAIRSLWRDVNKVLISVQPEFCIGMALIALSACQTQGNAPKLQGHLQGAKNASSDTAQHIGKTRNSIERIDYKAGRARKLLDEGFAK